MTILSPKTLALATLLFSAQVLLPSICIAASGEDFYYETTVTIDVKGLVAPDDPDYAQWQAQLMLVEVTKLLNEHDLSLVENTPRAANAAKLVVVLAWVDFDNSLMSVELKVVRPDGSSSSVEPFQCTCVHTTEIGAEIKKRLFPILRMLERPEPASSAKPVAPPPPQRDKAEPKKVGPATWVGSGLMAGGAIAAIVGGVLVGRGESTSVRAADHRFANTASNSTAGFVALGVGGASMLAGAILVTLDHTLWKRKRKARTMQVMPTPQSAGALLVWKGNF